MTTKVLFIGTRNYLIYMKSLIYEFANDKSES